MAGAEGMKTPVQMGGVSLGEAMERLREELARRGEPNPTGKTWRLMELLGVPPEEALAHPERPLRPEQMGRLASLISRIGEGEPFAYLTGEVEFCGLMFKVDRRALIPRPETELVVEAALSHLAPLGGEGRILDLGTGAGCMGIALARRLPRAEVWLADISSDALALAEENARRLGVSGRVRLLRWDFFEEPPEDLAGIQFDALVSNPPYVDEESAHLLSPEVRRFEPEVALFGQGGRAGTAAFCRLAELGRMLLRRGGVIAFEVGVGQGERAARLLGAGFRQVRTIRDLQGIVRVVLGVRR